MEAALSVGVIMAELAIALAFMMQVEGIETDERLRSVLLKCLSPGAL